MFYISLSRIDAQSLKLLLSLANMRHCSYISPGETEKKKIVSPGEMKTVTSTVDGIIFASYNSACPLAPNSMLNYHELLK